MEPQSNGFFIRKAIDNGIRHLWAYQNKLNYAIKKKLYWRKLNKEKEYWKTEKYVGREDGKEYYVIRRKGEAGLFSIYITTLGHIKYAVYHGLTPIVDLKNYCNSLMGIDKIGEYNPWEVLFEQPSGERLVDVEKRAKTLLYCTKETPDEWPSDDLDFLYSLNGENEWKDLASEYMRVKPAILKKAKFFFEEMAGDENYRTLGVLCRGTDYSSLHPKSHPVQPGIEEILAKTEQTMKQQNCQRIFLATEDASFEKKFRDRFGDALYVIKEKKIKYQGYGLLYYTTRLMSQQKRMKNAEIYLEKILVLSMCNCFVAGRTSGTVAVMLQEHHFDYTYFFDLGRY